VIKISKLILFVYTFGFLLTQSVYGSPWPGYGATKPVSKYSDDPAAKDNYQFGVTDSYTGYQDPDLFEAADGYNPLLESDYSSYNLIIVVNKESDSTFGRAQTMRVYNRQVTENNGLQYYWYISTGINGYETPSGYFVPQAFSSRHWSGQFEAPMLNSVFFSGGKALHTSIDTEALHRLGEAFSHGCVHIEDHRARELFHLIGHSGYGRVDKINGRGQVQNDSSGNPIQTNGYKTLIIIH
jgi:lipoprotein-anchoring transpeptidase ErfK/SrfK